MSWLKSTLRQVKAVVKTVVDVQNKVVNSQLSFIARVDEMMFDATREFVEDISVVLPSEARGRVLKHTYRIVAAATGSARFSVGLAKYLTGAFYGNEEMKDEGAFMMMFGFTSFMTIWNKLPSWLRAIVQIIIAIISFIIPVIQLIYMLIVAIMLIVLAKAAGRRISKASARERLAFIEEMYMYGILPDDLARQYEAIRGVNARTVSSATPMLEVQSSVDDKMIDQVTVASADYRSAVKDYYDGAIDALGGNGVTVSATTQTSASVPFALASLGLFILTYRGR